MGCRMRAQRSLLLLWQREMGWRGLGPGSFPAPSRWGWMAVGDAVGSVLGDPTDGAVSHCSHSEGMRCVAVWAPPHHTARETEARIRPPASPLHSSAVTALPLGGWDAAGGASGEPRGALHPPQGGEDTVWDPPQLGEGLLVQPQGWGTLHCPLPPASAPFLLWGVSGDAGGGGV